MEEYEQLHKGLSKYDRLCMAVAKSRGWILLSGDGLVRKKSKELKIDCRGTIWVVDEQIKNLEISPSRGVEVFRKLMEVETTRLPEKSIRIRISTLLKLAEQYKKFYSHF